MSTQPRMSAPIGRLRIKTSESRARRGSTTGRWRPAEPPAEAEMPEAEDALVESTHPPFYPFPLHTRDDDDT
jgi:hypothetical protein